MDSNGSLFSLENSSFVWKIMAKGYLLAMASTVTLEEAGSRSVIIGIRGRRRQ